MKHKMKKKKTKDKRKHSEEFLSPDLEPKKKKSRLSQSKVDFSLMNGGQSDTGKYYECLSSTVIGIDDDNNISFDSPSSSAKRHRKHKKHKHHSSENSVTSQPDESQNRLDCSALNDHTASQSYTSHNGRELEINDHVFAGTICKFSPLNSPKDRIRHKNKNNKKLSSGYDSLDHTAPVDVSSVLESSITPSKKRKKQGDSR